MMLLHFYAKLNDWDILFGLSVLFFFLKVSTIFYLFLLPSLFLCKMTKFLRNSDMNYIFRYVKYFWNKRYLNIHLYRTKESVLWKLAINKKRGSFKMTVISWTLVQSDHFWEETVIYPGTCIWHPFLASTITPIKRNCFTQDHTHPFPG